MGGVSGRDQYVAGPVITTVLTNIQQLEEPDMVMRTCGPSTQEPEAGRL